MKSRHLIALIILFCYTMTGILVYDDYGVSWDEPLQREYGEAVYNYITEGDTTLYAHPSRYHGPVFQVLLYSIEKVADTSSTTFNVRHLITFLFSVIGLWFFYKLLLLLDFRHYWAAIGILFLICSPRIFAHSFYNSKDAVFMYMFIICMYALVRFIKKPKVVSALLLAALTGLLVDIRILGLFVPIFLIGIWFLRTVSDFNYGKRSYPLMLFCGATCLLIIVAFWPTLWRNPIEEVGYALAKMRDYPWDDPVLFQGSFDLPKNLPWFYLPKWMLISTPITLIAFSGIGLLPWVIEQKRTLWVKLIPFIWLVPLVVIVAKGATVYDGWRHVFFLYPAFIVLAVCGAEFLFNRWASAPFLKYVPAVLMLFPITFMVRSHPHQQVYFNPTTWENAWQNFEMDYWGLSYKQALEHVCKIQPTGTLKVSAANTPGFYNANQIEEADRNRIEWVGADSADFFLSNYRFPSEFEAFKARSGYYANPLVIIDVDGNPIVGVFDLRD